MMKLIIKILTAILAVVLLITAALSVFVHYYLTDERVKKLLVPKLENVLAREVRLEDVKVSLWKGVTFKDFVILEADGQDDFVKVGGFNLSYDLLPLLKKKVQISRVVLNNPQVRVVRYANGKFNFESLKPLAAAGGGDTPGTIDPSDQSVESVLPLALTVKEIKVKNADMALRDELREIPAVKASADGTISLETGKDLSTLKYRGRLDITAEAIYEVIETRLSGGGSFDQNQADFSFDFQVKDQEVTISGMIKDYLGAPDITCNLESPALDLDYLLAALGGGEKGGDSGKGKGAGPTDETAGRPIGGGIPEGLQAHGQVRVAQAAYRDLDFHDVQVDYALQDSILHIKDLRADTAEGVIAGQAGIDLNKLEPDYNATFIVRGMQLGPLQKSLFARAGDRISGNLIADVKVSGAGFRWPALRDTLNGEGTYTLLQGRIRQIEILKAVSALLREDRLQDIHYDELSGNFWVRNGDIMLKTSLQGEQVDIVGEGMVGLDGKLAMPLDFQFSPDLLENLASRTFLSKYLMEENGAAHLNLYLTGSLANPKVSLDTASAREKIKVKLTDTIKDKAREEIDQVFDRDRREPSGTGEKVSPEEVVNEFIKGVLGE